MVDGLEGIEPNHVGSARISKLRVEPTLRRVLGTKVYRETLTGDGVPNREAWCVEPEAFTILLRYPIQRLACTGPL